MPAWILVRPALALTDERALCQIPPHTRLHSLPVYACASFSGLPDEEGIPHQVAEAFEHNEVYASCVDIAVCDIAVCSMRACAYFCVQMSVGFVRVGLLRVVCGT